MRSYSVHCIESGYTLRQHKHSKNPYPPEPEVIKYNSEFYLYKDTPFDRYNFFKEKQKNKNPLDQIGNDDLIFNNDKLITTIKLDNLDNSVDEGSLDNGKNEDSPKPKKFEKKKNLTPVSRRNEINIKKINISKNNNDNDSIDLKYNKINNNQITKRKSKNYRNLKINKNLLQINRPKLINKFINKPQESIKHKKNMSPSNRKMVGKISYHISTSKLSNLDLNPMNDNHNDNSSLVSGSKIVQQSCTRVKSVPNFKKSTMRFPNKSVMKNKDKLYSELQKLFGDKIQLFDDTYQSMSDSDKKNCINFLLESIKELFNINKNIQIKSEGYKVNSDAKERQIKENKKEIKELKKDIAKLNKIIKTNIQMNRKLSQNIDNLKLQLEKEKNKNKELQKRGKSTDRKNSNQKLDNEYCKFSHTTTKRNRYVSQDRFRNTNDFINKKKKISFNNIKYNNDKKLEKNIININNIKVEESKNNSGENNIKAENMYKENNNNLNNNNKKLSLENNNVNEEKGSNINIKNSNNNFKDLNNNNNDDESNINKKE